VGRVARKGLTLTPGYLGATWRRQVRDCAPAAYGPCAIRTASKFVTAQQGRGLAELPDFGTAVFRRRPIAPQQGIASIGWPRGFRSTNDRISAGMKFGTTEILTRSRTSPRRPCENSRIRVAMLFRWSSTSRAMATRLGPDRGRCETFIGSHQQLRAERILELAEPTADYRGRDMFARSRTRDGVVLDDSHEHFRERGSSFKTTIAARLRKSTGSPPVTVYRTRPDRHSMNRGTLSSRNHKTTTYNPIDRIYQISDRNWKHCLFLRS